MSITPFAVRFEVVSVEAAEPADHFLGCLVAAKVQGDLGDGRKRGLSLIFRSVEVSGLRGILLPGWA